GGWIGSLPSVALTRFANSWADGPLSVNCGLGRPEKMPMVTVIASVLGSMVASTDHDRGLVHAEAAAEHGVAAAVGGPRIGDDVAAVVEVGRRSPAHLVSPFAVAVLAIPVIVEVGRNDQCDLVPAFLAAAARVAVHRHQAVGLCPGGHRAAGHVAGPG